MKILLVHVMPHYFSIIEQIACKWVFGKNQVIFGLFVYGDGEAMIKLKLIFY